MAPPAGSHYAALGLEVAAPPDEVRKAHRALALKWHPDKVASAGDEIAVKVATQQFQLVQAAYEELSDTARRKRYDARIGVLSAWLAAADPAGDDLPPWKAARAGGAARRAAGGDAGCWAQGEKSELRVPEDLPTVAAAVDSLPASGGTVHVAAGTFPGLVVVSKPLVRIVGAGSGFTTICGQVVFRECAAGSQLKGMRFDANCTAGAVDLKGVIGDVTLEDCRISNRGSAGLVLEGCSGVTRLVRCAVVGCRYDGLGIHPPAGTGQGDGLASTEAARAEVVAEDCSFQDNGYDGLYLGDARFSVSLVRCRIVRNRRHGVLVRGTVVHITECCTDGNGKDAVRHEVPPALCDTGAPAAERKAVGKPKPREVSAESLGLPEGWRAFRTAEGLTYYFHTASGSAQWSHPCEGAASAKPDAAALAGGQAALAPTSSA